MTSSDNDDDDDNNNNNNGQLWQRIRYSDKVRAGRCGIQLPAGARDIFVLQNVQTGCEAHATSLSMGVGFNSCE